MQKFTQFLSTLKNDNKGQDLIEYALMAGFVAVAAGIVLPDVSTSIAAIFNKLNAILSPAASGS